MLEELALVLTLLGGAMSVLPKLIETRRQRNRKTEAPADGGRKVVFRALRQHEQESIGAGGPTSRHVLATFAVVVVIFALLVLWRYWPQIAVLGDTLFLAFGLLLAMIAGMFVQVLSANFNDGRPLLAVSPSHLLYPLLFSPIVFYPIWLVGYKQGAQVFSFYAAFLNGYFWQSVVSTVKRPGST